MFNSLGDDKHRQGVVKRGGATVKWLSPEQNLAKVKGRQRHEQELHKAEKDRVMQFSRTLPIKPAPLQSEDTGNTGTVTTLQGITINGMNFQVSSGGSKLVRLDSMCATSFTLNRITQVHLDEPNWAMTTPKETTINGVLFRRSKHGNLIRAKAIMKGFVATSHRRHILLLSPLTWSNRFALSKEKTELCRKYTSTGT